MAESLLGAGRYDPPTSSSASPYKNKRTEQLSQQIDETVGIMRDNINKANQRGENLDSLQDKTDNLATSAQGFRRGANKVRKQVRAALRDLCLSTQLTAWPRCGGKT